MTSASAMPPAADRANAAPEEVVDVLLVGRRTSPSWGRSQSFSLSPAQSSQPSVHNSADTRATAAGRNLSAHESRVCFARAQILEQSAVAECGATVRWAPTVPAPSTLVTAIKIEADAVDVVTIVTNRLRRTKIEPTSVSRERSRIYATRTKILLTRLPYRRFALVD
jgi:hypothetical protein